jgi:hypothetical protein
MKPRRTTVLLLLLFLFSLIFQGWLWWWSMKESMWLQRTAPAQTQRVGVAEGSVLILHFAGNPGVSKWGKFEVLRFHWSTYFPDPPAVPVAWRFESILGPGSEGKRVALWVLMLAECALFLPFMAWRSFLRRRKVLH